MDEVEAELVEDPVGDVVPVLDDDAVGWEVVAGLPEEALEISSQELRRLSRNAAESQAIFSQWGLAEEHSYYRRQNCRNCL